VIDEVGNSGFTRTWNESLAQSLDRLALFRIEKPERHSLRTRFARREQHLDAAHREGERTCGRALHEGAPFDFGHWFPPEQAAARHLMRAGPSQPRNMPSGRKMGRPGRPLSSLSIQTQ
jgi:hypothetical protein